MITKEKIKVYKKNNGNIDIWARSTSKSDLIMNDSDWYLIDGLVQDNHLVRNNLASKEFATKLDIRLTENCDTIATIELVKKLSLR